MILFEIYLLLFEISMLESTMGKEKQNYTHTHTHWPVGNAPSGYYSTKQIK